MHWNRIISFYADTDKHTKANLPVTPLFLVGVWNYEELTYAIEMSRAMEILEYVYNAWGLHSPPPPICMPSCSHVKFSVNSVLPLINIFLMLRLWVVQFHRLFLNW